MPEPAAHGLFLDNQTVPPGGRSLLAVVDPADGSIIGSVARASADDARAAMESCAKAQPAWEAIGASARAAILLRAAERLRSRREELALSLIHISEPTRP